jgi:hypothetical protein
MLLGCAVLVAKAALCAASTTRRGMRVLHSNLLGATAALLS